MLEWLKRHAWKACIRQKRIGGSNPPYSAKKPLQVFCSGFFCRRNGGLLRRCKMNRSIISGASFFIYIPTPLLETAVSLVSPLLLTQHPVMLRDTAEEEGKYF